jgi:hypothetical protein
MGYGCGMLFTIASVVEWHTRTTQNRLLARACGFNSRRWHQSFRSAILEQ